MTANITWSLVSDKKLVRKMCVVSQKKIDNVSFIDKAGCILD